MINLCDNMMWVMKIKFIVFNCLIARVRKLLAWRLLASFSSWAGGPLLWGWAQSLWGKGSMLRGCSLLGYRPGNSSWTQIRQYKHQNACLNGKTQSSNSSFLKACPKLQFKFTKKMISITSTIYLASWN